jgi:hypothetical protein
VQKYNRRGKPEVRDFIITDTALYLIIKEVKKKVVIHRIMRRTPLREVRSLSLSTLADNFIVFHVPEYDNVFENDKKTEIAVTLNEVYQAVTNSKLNIAFSDRIAYAIKGGDQRELNFQRNDQAITPIVKKGGKGLIIGVATGLPKDTDTSPPRSSMQAPVNVPVGRGRGRGQPQGGGYAAPQQQAYAAPQQAYAPPQQQTYAPPQGRGAPTGVGRAAPTGRGAPANTAAGPGRGATGAARGAPTGRGAPVAAGPGRGAPPAQQQRAAAKPTVTALYDYDATTEDELSFKEGDQIVVIQKDQGGWWEGELRGKRGWIPANYVK